MPRRRAITFTLELLGPVVRESVTYAEVLRRIGIVKWSGGTQGLLKKRIEQHGLDTSHFTGQSTNSGEGHTGGPSKSPWQKILILRPSGLRQKSHLLRRALLESGRSYSCCDCGNSGTWNDKILRLQVDHKDGNWLNDCQENLEFRCPNCHSQTDGWSGSYGGTSVTSVAEQFRNRRAKRKEEKSQRPSGGMADTSA